MSHCYSPSISSAVNPVNPVSPVNPMNSLTLTSSYRPIDSSRPSRNPVSPISSVTSMSSRSSDASHILASTYRYSVSNHTSYSGHINRNHMSVSRHLEEETSSANSHSPIRGKGKGKGAKGRGKRGPISSLTPLSDEFESPSNGTDILTRPQAVIRCQNQTQCIRPALQLERTYDVYYCKRVSYGVRFYFLVLEGLLLHPNIRIVDSPEQAEIILYLPESAAWHKSECNKPEYASKMVVMDESDGPQIMSQPGRWYILYFKRSFIHRNNGAFRGYMNYLFHRDDVMPMTYPLANAYVRPKFSRVEDRDLDIVCTLRENPHDPTRSRIKGWVNEYAQLRGLSNFQGKEVNRASRTTVDSNYLNQMFRARIIVTANPSGWEGDFRLMEAIASGALILVDKMYTPRPFPLKHQTHVIYYDNHNKTDLFEKLDFYRDNVRRARSIAAGGYLHAMKFHRAPCLLDYVLRTVHMKMLQQSGSTNIPSYTETGFDMHRLARQMAERHKKKMKAAIRRRRRQ